MNGADLSTIAHDPSSAWLVVLAYAVGAALCLVAARAACERRDRYFWILAAVILLLLGINKQLDLQSYLTPIGRDLARAQGWYEWRRQAEIAFLLLLGIGATAVSVALILWLRGSRTQLNVAAVGMVVLVTFVLMRAATFYHSAVLQGEFIAVSLAHWIELIGIGLVAAAAGSFRAMAGEPPGH